VVKQRISIKTRNNWLIDAALFSSALIAFLTGIYFLFLPVGGYQGGRNPMYGVTILFKRSTWEDLHTWGGIIMIAIAAIHLTLHWGWVVNMTRRAWNDLRQWRSSLNPRGRFNLVLDLVVAVSFLIVAVSSLYFLFIPGGRSVTAPMLLFSRDTWDMLHTWSGTVLIVAAVVHFAIHWGWVVKVSRSIVKAAGQVLNSRPFKKAFEKA
jgi:preprotein translocase subunit SecY